MPVFLWLELVSYFVSALLIFAGGFAVLTAEGKSKSIRVFFFLCLIIFVEFVVAFLLRLSLLTVQREFAPAILQYPDFYFQLFSMILGIEAVYFSVFIASHVNRLSTIQHILSHLGLIGIFGLYFLGREIPFYSNLHMTSAGLVSRDHEPLTLLALIVALPFLFWAFAQLWQERKREWNRLVLLGLFILASGNICEMVLLVPLPVVAFTNLTGTIILSFAVIRSQAMLPARQRSERLRTEIADSKATENHLSRLFDEKETLLREVHHRVKNTFQVLISLLNLQRNASDDLAERKATAEIRTRVYSMALVHEKIYRTENYSGILMGEYLKSLAHDLRTSNGHQRHIIKVQAPELKLGVDQAVYSGMVVYELVRHALEQASGSQKPCSVLIKLECDTPDYCQLGVSTDGPSLSMEDDIQERNGLGFQLIKILLEELSADSRVVSGPDPSFVFTFPAKSATPTGWELQNFMQVS